MRSAIWVDDLIGAVMQLYQQFACQYVCSAWNTNLVYKFDVSIHQIGLAASIIIPKKGPRYTFWSFGNRL